MDPSTQVKKKSGIMTSTCHPVLGIQTQAEDSPASQPSLISRLHILEALSEEGGRWFRGTTFEFDLSPLHTYICTLTHINACIYACLCVCTRARAHAPDLKRSIRKPQRSFKWEKTVTIPCSQMANVYLQDTTLSFVVVLLLQGENSDF